MLASRQPTKGDIKKAPSYNSLSVSHSLKNCTFWHSDKVCQTAKIYRNEVYPLRFFPFNSGHLGSLTNFVKFPQSSVEEEEQLYE